jgi:hypothetical protein
MALLSYCVTASLRGAKDADLRSLLKHRIMIPLGVPNSDWSCGYDSATSLDGMTLIANWGGGSYSPDATARIGRRCCEGDWREHDDLRRMVFATTQPECRAIRDGLRQTATRTEICSGWPRRRPPRAQAQQADPAGHTSLDLMLCNEINDNTMSFDAGLEAYVINP